MLKTSCEVAALNLLNCYIATSPELVCGNIFIRPIQLSGKGDKINGHFHNYDHTTFIFKGSVHVLAKLPDGSYIEKEFSAGSFFLTRKDVEHEITALENDTYFACVYSHRNAQGEVVQEATGWDTRNILYPEVYV